MGSRETLRRASGVTVVLGGEIWHHERCLVDVSEEAGTLQIWSSDSEHHLATAPLSAAYIEWEVPETATSGDEARAREMWYT